MEPPAVPPYRETAVAPAFRDYVACIWHSSSLNRPRQTTILPDGCIDVIWKPGAPPFIAGPMTTPVTSVSPAGSAALGIRFQPGAAAAVLGVSAAELRDILVPLVDVLPARYRHVSLDRVLVGAETLSVDVATAALEALLRRANPPHRLIVGASRWFACHPGQPAAAFVASSGVSERQVRRLFHDHVGYGPKMLQRILRLQRVLWLLSRPDRPLSLAQVALAGGYADQAHLTREMQALAGQRPSDLVMSNPQSAVADLFKTPFA